jgi:hypothetical protein
MSCHVTYEVFFIGTLETYDNAALKCRRQQKKIDEKLAKVGEVIS